MASWLECYNKSVIDTRKAAKQIYISATVEQSIFQCLNSSLILPGTANQAYDTKEAVVKQGMNSIKRVASGAQDSANELIKGVMGGINAAHRETMDTVQDAILSKWSMISKHVSPRSNSVGTCILMINAFFFRATGRPLRL